MKEYAEELADLWHHMPSGYERTGGFWFVRAGRNIASPHYHVGPKQIESYGLHFVLSGELVLRYGNNEVKLGANDMFCLFPHLTYEYWIQSTDSLQMIWLTMEGPQMRELMQRIGLIAKQPFRYGAITPECRERLRMMEEVIWHDPLYRLSVMKLMSAAYHLFEELEHEPAAGTLGAAPSEEHWVDEALRFFQLHYTETLRVETVAGMFGLHRSHFSHVFAQKVGVSPQQYVQRLRLTRAGELLMDVSLQIGEIASSVGYPDLYTFSRAFKRYHGCSPSDYRRLSEKELN
ncbi:AraC family transcriptional regulator [Paenibacillus sp. KQZ6P-2]|uniref:AraC family transcriptional regulator n=1 Tax=Paenibacillus mangrovi TaxID=2931978 RepID=A0A9X2B3C9_9BACL|nr:AraC family transcriptional regulator [Paenibacillus mangrovi]MCJ8013261.1 AraC family transcriptional regulator [Paenibacillus mangrovi]